MCIFEKLFQKKVEMSSSTVVETFLKKPDDSTTGGHVVEFLNSRFRELENLEKLDSILSSVKKRETELEEKVYRITQLFFSLFLL